MSMTAEPVLGGPSEPVLAVDNVGQLLQNALEDGGIVGLDEAIEQAYMTKALRHANWLLAQWARKRWLVYSESEYAFIATGANFYNVGLGQIVNINPRPDRLEYAYMRFLNSSEPVQFPVDIPLDIIPSKEDYSRITVKTIGTLPWRVFYDPQWPIGQLYPWPVPQQSQYELHFGFKTVLPRFASLTQKINFPPEYETALSWALAERLRAAFQLPPDPTITKLAREGLSVLRLANQAVSTLVMPSFLRSRNRGYDYRGDSDSY
jgi:hypothetical protein